MISLIINADDLGSNQDRDRGILKAFKQGIVTSASMLANGPSFNTAVSQVKEAELPVGVHLNLSDGSALTGTIEGLTDAEGKLPGKRKLRRFLATGLGDHAAVHDELAAQIERLLSNGLQPDHLDGHQHCQLFPSLTAIVIQLAREYNIPALRTSRPAESATQDPVGPLGEELALYRRLSREAHTQVLDAGLRTTDGLWGMPLLNQLDTNSLCQLLENIPEGRWELMTHPGEPSFSGRPFDGPQRHAELLALISGAAKDVIMRRKIHLCSFGELPCAS